MLMSPVPFAIQVVEQVDEQQQRQGPVDTGDRLVVPGRHADQDYAPVC